MERIEYLRMAELEDSLWWYESLHADVCDWLALIDLPAGSCLLDAGCGTGGLLHHIHTLYPALHPAGLEFDHEASHIARSKTAAPIVQGTIEHMPYPDGHFAAAISNDVLSNKINRQAALHELHRCLQPGGHLYLNLPAFEWMKSSHDRHVHTEHRFTTGETRKLLASAGFEVMACHYRQGLLFPVMIVRRLFAARDSDSSDVKPIHPTVNRALLAIAQLESTWNAKGVHLPFGGSVKAWARKP